MSSANASGAHSIFCGLLAGINSTLVGVFVFNNVRLIEEFFIFGAAIALIKKERERHSAGVIHKVEEGLFENFKNYVDFFLLNDLVSLDYSEVKLFLPAERLFDESPLPRDTGSYKKYYENSINFTQARNKRISSWVNLNRTKQD